MTASQYPDAPGFKAPGPSEQAAEQIAPSAMLLRAAVLKKFEDHYPQGRTADEVAGELRQSILSVRPRVSELKRGGLLIDTGERRKNESGMTATVWRYFPPNTQGSMF